MSALPDPESLRGELPDSVDLDSLEWWRLARLIEQAVLVQHHEARTKILAASGQVGEKGGPMINVEIRPFTFDPDTGLPFLLVTFQGQELLRVSMDRLMPKARLDLDPMPK